MEKEMKQKIKQLLQLVINNRPGETTLASSIATSASTGSKRGWLFFGVQDGRKDVPPDRANDFVKEGKDLRSYQHISALDCIFSSFSIRSCD